MGWSCRAEAAKTERRHSELCVKATGMSNVWKEGDAFYMTETSRREHADGAITGTVMRFLGDPMKPSPACRVGSFRIEPNGEVKRGPAILKRAAREAHALFFVEEVC